MPTFCPQASTGCSEFTVAIAGSPCGFTEAAILLSDNAEAFDVTFWTTCVLRLFWNRTTQGVSMPAPS